MTAEKPSQFYVHAIDDNPIGPVSADLIARGVLAGHVQHGTFVAPVGASTWVPLESVPEVTAAIDAAMRVEEGQSAMAARTMVIPPVPATVTLPPVMIPPTIPPLPLFEPAATSLPPPAVTPSEPKSEPKKPALDPRAKLLPLAIFAAFAACGVLETLVTLIARR
jgi:hypothetical protein